MGGTREKNQETTTEDQQRSLEMFPDFNRSRDPHHHSHPFKHKPTPCPSNHELSPPYLSLYKHHHLPYLPLTQNKQHQGEETKYWKFHPLFLMNEYWKFLQFLLHPGPSLIQSPRSMLSFWNAESSLHPTLYRALSSLFQDRSEQLASSLVDSQI